MKKKKRKELRFTKFEQGTLPPGGMRAVQADDIYINNLYQVNIKWNFRGLIHLSVKRRNKSPVMDWRHLQRIKNELLGPETEMVQLFPSESRLVDTANQYHFFALPNLERFPLGYEDGRLVTDTIKGKGSEGAKQRAGSGATEEDEQEFEERKKVLDKEEPNKVS